VVLSYFLVAGGTFFAALLAGRLGLHSEYLGYIVLALGGFAGGLVAARASKGSTVIEPGIGAVLLLASVVGLGLAASGTSAHVVLLPATMKAIALTGAASAGGGIVGAFVTEKLFADDQPAPLSWVLFVGLAAFGAGMIGTTIGALLGRGAGVMLGTLAGCCFVVGIASGASARSRPLGASFLGGVLGLGGFNMLAVLVLANMFSAHGASSENIPAEMYIGIAVIALAGGLATMIGAAIGWATAGRTQ
jgi:hypothetical protein